MNHSLNSSSVIDNVRNAVADIQAAMNKGVSVEGVAGSYAKYGDFKHLLENVDDNHSPIITNARAQEVSCRTVMFTASATDEDNDTLSYKWEFDDGAVIGQMGVPDMKLGGEAAHGVEARSQFRIMSPRYPKQFILRQHQPCAVKSLKLTSVSPK